MSIHWTAFEEFKWIQNAIQSFAIQNLVQDYTFQLISQVLCILPYCWECILVNLTLPLSSNSNATRKLNCYLKVLSSLVLLLNQCGLVHFSMCEHSLHLFHERSIHFINDLLYACLCDRLANLKCSSVVATTFNIGALLCQINQCIHSLFCPK